LDGARTSLVPCRRENEPCMVLLPLRQVRLPKATEKFYDGWLADLEAQLAEPGANWHRLTRDLLFQIYYPGIQDYDELLQDPRTPDPSRVALLSLDPWNITLEPEYYAEVDAERYARVKPLLWLWQSFDRSLLGGGNVHLGIRFRRILAPHIFARVGKNFKCFQNVEFSFGYNLEVGDDVVVHRNVLLDDRGGITLGNRVSISDYANIYSHTHSIVDQKDVTNARTVLEDDVRITYHATVLAGVRVGRNAMVGANAVATKDVRPYHVNVGIPAKSIRVKPNAPPEAYVTERVARRDSRES
jgi:acetyltransferase-like isoleucine patch superfamily enzyme